MLGREKFFYQTYFIVFGTERTRISHSPLKLGVAGGPAIKMWHE